MLRAGGAEVDVLAKDRAHHGKYSLEVTVRRAVVTQPPTPAGKPPPPPVTTLVPLNDVRIRILAADDAASRQGQTIARPGKAPAGKCLFDHLAKGRYGLQLYHDCFAEDPHNPKVESVRADPTRGAMKMELVHLRTIANKRGVVLGVRTDAALVAKLSGNNLPLFDDPESRLRDRIRHEPVGVT